MANLITGLGVHIKVRSIAESRRFYENFLELTPVFAYGDEKFLKTVPSGVPTAPERYSGITYEISGGAKIEIADGHIAVDKPEIFADRIESPKVSAMFNVSSLVPLLQKGIHKRKGKEDKGVMIYYWDTLELVVRDPDGWVIVLIAPKSQEEIEAVCKLAKVKETFADRSVKDVN